MDPQRSNRRLNGSAMRRRSKTGSQPSFGLRRRPGLGLAAGLAALLSAQAAVAHGGAIPYTSDLFLDEKGELIGGGGNYGLVFLDNGGAWWTAIETLDGTTTPRFFYRTADGRILGAPFTGLYETSDDGCSWTLLDGPLKGLSVADVVADPADPNHLFAVTTLSSATNDVFESTDAGRVWAAAGLESTEHLYQGIVVAPGARELWVQSRIEAEGTTPIFGSRDGAQSWGLVGADLSAYTDVRLLGISLDGSAVHLAGLLADGTDCLLLSTDGIDSVTEVTCFAGVGEVTDYAELGDDRFATLCAYGQPGRCTESFLYRSASGGPFVREIDGPTRCLVTDPKTNTLWGCGWLNQPGQFFKSTDGQIWEAIAPYQTICAGTCADGTDGAQLRSKEWTNLAQYSIGVDCAPPGGDAGPSMSSSNAGRDGGSAPSVGSTGPGGDGGSPQAGGPDGSSIGRSSTGRLVDSGEGDGDPTAPAKNSQAPGCACRTRAPPASGNAPLWTGVWIALSVLLLRLRQVTRAGRRASH